MKTQFIMTKGTTILCLLFISGFCSFTYSSSDFHFVNSRNTYTKAKSYCREMYTDLATVRNSADVASLIALVPTNLKTWIGLEIGEVQMWHWSSSDEGLDFRHWKAGEPQSNSKHCAAMSSDGEWVESDCVAKKSFVCHGGNDTTGPIFIHETKSWRKAQNYCRNKASDLVSIHSAEENQAVQNVSPSQTVWIGLFKDAWKWSDGSNSSFRYWKSKQPNSKTDQDCVAAIFKDIGKGKWNDLKCKKKLEFICHGARKSPVTTKQTSTQQAATTVQMLTTRPVLSNSSSQEVITSTFQTTTALASTEQSNTVNVTTKQAITGNSMDHNVTSTFELTTLNTIEPVSSLNSSTELNHVTTETVPVTETHPPPTATMQITRDDISVSTTQDGTSAYSTTDSSTPMPSENSQGLTSEKLMLIQENMTWNEAVSYCREHYVDLVSVTSENIHKWVAEKAKNATSSHVWIGLRYTCSFKFWFWIKSVTGCYQNWAPGHGPEGEYGCGVTGAIETTGGQQWAGLPETDKLNFICYTC